MITATADASVIREYLSFYADRPGFLSVCSDTNITGRRFTTDGAGLEAATNYALKLDERMPKGIYVQVTTLREAPATGRGGEDLAHCITYVWADGDYGTIGHKPGEDELPHPADADAVMKVVTDAIPLEPTVWSNSGGGLNPAWAIEPYVIGDDADRARIKKFTTDWQTILGATAYTHGFTWDIGVGNIDRLIKLPGTLNRKEGLCRPTGIVGGGGQIYDLGQLMKLAERLAPEAHEALAQANREKQGRRAKRTGQPIPPPRAAKSTRLHTGAGPLDVLADTMRFGDVLGPAGFTFRGYYGDGREKWLRSAVGGDPSSEYSLLCNDHVAVNWSERSDLPVGAQAPGQKLTIGRLYAHLNYGGDTSGAAKDILRAAAGKPAFGAAGSLPIMVLAEVKRRCMEPEEDRAVQSQSSPDSPHDWSDVEGGEGSDGSSVNSVRQSGENEPEWEVPLSIDRPPMTPFPTKLLGPKLAAMVEAVADQVQVAPDLPAMIALPTITTAIGGRRTVRIRDGWTEAPSLWTATVAGPGERKSAAEGPFTDVLRARQKELGREMAPKIEEAEQDAEIALARLEEAKRTAIKAKPVNLEMAKSDAKLAKQAVAELPPVPTLPRILFGDITPAAMPVKAAQQGGRMAVLHSEGTLIKQMAGLYNSGTPETGFALDAYDGKAMPVDRIGRDSVEMESAHLSIGLLIQPVILEQLGRKKDDEMLHNGFVQRFLYGLPPSSLGHQEPRRSTPIPAKVSEDFERRISDLVTKLWSSSGTQEIRFTAQANEDMYVFQEQLQERLRLGGDLHSIASWGSKLPGKLARIAAAITLYENPDATTVGSERLQAALGMAPYFVQHARLCLDLMGANRDAKLIPARDVLDWLRRRKADDRGKPFSVRDAQRGVDGNAWKPDGVTAEAVQAAVAILIDRGWVRPLPQPEREPGQRGRSPSPTFDVHPLIWDDSWKREG